MPRLTLLAQNVNAAIGDDSIRQLFLQPAAGAVDIKNGDNQRPFPRRLLQKRKGLCKRVTLETDKDNIRSFGPCLQITCHIIGGKLHRETFLRQIHRQPLPPNGFQMRATGNQGDILPRAGQKSSNGTARTPCA